MTDHLLTRRTCMATVLALSGLPLFARAQDFPARSVKIIVPYPPGGATDIIARLLAERLGTVWNQAVVVDNKGGASGMIGADAVAKSPPDGHTILVSTNAEVAINQSLYSRMPYDPSRELRPLTLAAVAPLLLVAGPSVRGTTIKELIQSAAARGKPLTYASPGSGSVHHLAGALLESRIKAGMTHVPYRGASPSIADLLGGQVDCGFFVMPPVLPHIRAGKLRPIAVAAAERVPLLPDVPTVNDAMGFNDFEISNWFGVFAPARTPDATAQKVSADAQKVLALPDVRARIAEQGAEPVGNSKEDFEVFWKKEIVKYARIVKASGATVS